MIGNKTFSTSNCIIPTNFEVTYPITNDYTGEYVVTPKLNETQVLETQDKSMLENVTIEPISVVRVGGTVIIGG